MLIYFYVDIAINIARSRGFDAEEKDGRLYVSGFGSNASTMVLDGQVSRLMFDRILDFLNNARGE